MPFDPSQPFEVLQDSADAESSGFDPSQPFEVLPPNQSATRNSLNAAARGATSEGFYSGVEGAARQVAKLPTTLLVNLPKAAKSAERKFSNKVRNIVGLGDLPADPMEEKFFRGAQAVANIAEKYLPNQVAAAWYADAVSGTRADLREALPVDPEFQESLFGQIVQGVGQAAGTLPTFVVPGGGAGMAVGQLYDQAYQDALQHGADVDTAHQAGLANVPAAALEYAGDKLILGRILKPLKGKVTIRQFLKGVGANALSEGATEGAQQVWGNLVAQSLVGYDPDRTLDDQVVNSILVGAATGGVVSAAGQSGSAALRPGEQAAAASEDPSSVVRPPSSDSPSGFDPNQPFEVVSDAFDQSALRDPQSAIDSPAPAAAVGAAPEPAAAPPESAPPPAPLAQSEPAGVEQPAGADTPSTPSTEPTESIAAALAQNPLPAAPTAGSQAIRPAEVAPTEPVETGLGGPPVIDALSMRVPGRKSWVAHLPMHPAGQPDLLDAIAELGGLRSLDRAARLEARNKDISLPKGAVLPPELRQSILGSKGEYDYPEALSQYPAKQVVHPRGLAPDEMAEMLGDLGYNFQGDVSAMFTAIERAQAERIRAAPAALKLKQESRFASEVVQTEGRKAGKSQLVPADTLPVGAKFKSRSEPFEVVGVDPDTGATIVRDGPRYGTQAVPPGTPLRIDPRSLRRPKAVAATEDAPFARRRPLAPDAAQSDLFTGGETGGDTLFNLQGEEMQDATGAIDRLAADRAAIRAQQAAQSGFAFTNPQSPLFRRLPPGTQFAIQRPSEYLGAQLPGYVQVDFFDAAGENTRSASPEAIAAEGWDLPPGTTGLPTGTYQVDTAGTLQPVADLAAFRRDANRQRSAELAALAAQHARWLAAVEKLAPGLMQRFRLEFGDPSALVESGHAKAEQLTGWEEAAYLAKERIFHLFDRALAANPDDRTILNLLHEMGHAHWDTLSATEQERLVDRWEQETTKRTGPLYAKGKLRPEVALGVEVDVREWYAERVAFANRAFARRRANEAFGYGNDPVQAAAAKLRALLRQLLEWVAKLHPERTIVADFRQFLDTPARPAPRPAMVGDFEFATAQRSDFQFAQRQGGPSESAPMASGDGAAQQSPQTSPPSGQVAKPLFSESNRITALRQDGPAMQRIRAENPGVDWSAPTITVFRASIGEALRPNDFVAANRSVAEAHVDNLRDRGEGDARVRRYKVAPSDLLMANDATEFVYFPRPESLRAEGGASFAVRMPAAGERRAAGLRDWLKREFTSRGDLPQAVFEAQIQRRAKLAEVEKAMRFALRDFDRALHAVYGGYRALTSPQLAQLNDALGGKLPLAQLDPRLRAPLTQMRQHIDTVSRELVRSGAVSGNLVGTISSNLGFYLNRSYRKFDDPKWAEKVPAAVRNRAASFLRAELRDQMLEELADQQLAAARQQAGLPALPAGLARRQPQWQTIRTQLAANATLQPKEEEVQGLVEYLLRKDVTAEGGRISGPKVEGAKDLSVLQRRQEIPEEIRALFGEYEDPRVNYARSVAKSASLVMAHRFLGEVRAAGLRGGWLHTKPTASARGNFSVQLAAEGSRTLAPLNGLYTSPEIAAAFKQLEQGASDDTLFRAWRTLNGWIKTAKTVLNPVTQVRNHVANYGFLLANGYWHLPEGAKVLQALRTELTGATTGRAYVSRLARLGVIGESVAAGEVREALADAGAKLSGIEPWLESRLARAAKAPLRAAERVYQLNDEVFKIYAFENERRGWAAALPQATPEQLDRLAAERVRNTLPTYSLIPRFAQRLRRYNLTGSFLSFPAEILRTGYHTLSYIKQDLGSANPAIRAMGARRLAGVALASSLIPAVAMVGRALAGVDKDDDRDVRRFLPEWSRNSDLLYTTPLEGGRVRLVDLSYLDPWNYLRKPVSAFLRGEDWQGSLLGAAGEATAPFIGEGLLTKRIADVLRNRTEQGAPIWNPAAAPLDRSMAGLGHLVEGFEPGIVTQGRRLWRAMTGYVAPTGRKYNLEDELLATTTGARSLSFDATDAHGFAARRYAAAKQQAEQLYTSVKNGQGTTTPEELAAAREEMEAARRALFDEATADTSAALRLGVARADALINLRDSGLGETESALVLTGRYLPYTDKPLAKWEILRRLRQQQRQPAE